MSEVWQRVILETPYAGNIVRNLAYLRACMHECVRRGWSPYASHGLLTQPGVLRDEDPGERRRGIEAGLAWSSVADFIVVGVDLGLSRGMSLGLDFHRARGVGIEELSLPEWKRGLELEMAGHDTVMSTLVRVYATARWEVP